MHLQFYHLNRPPFQLATDPEFFWEEKNYLKALDVLKYSLEHHGGLSLLTGTAGSGKSIIVRALLDGLGDRVRAVVISDSSLTGQEFYELVAHGFNLPAGMENRRAFHDHIQALLLDAGQNNQQVLLVVDEAQQLSGELIDEIDALINLHPLESGGLGICLVGQADTAQALVPRVDQAFENHVIVRYHLAPFSPEETGTYIEHRLRVAGADRTVFTADAIREIHHCSGGCPGRINIICDLALFAGYSENAAEIGATVIQMSAAKLQFPGVQGRPEHVDPTERSAELEAEDGNNLVSTGKDKSVSVTPDGVEAVVSAEPGGRSFVMPALVVLLALVFAGYVYMERDDTRLIAEPAAYDPPPIDATTALPPPREAGKGRGGFDAVGYSPPGEDVLRSQQPVDGDMVTTAPAPLAAGDSASESVWDVDEEAVGDRLEASQDRLEVQALQVEESLSVPSSGEGRASEPVDFEASALQKSLSAAVAEPSDTDAGTDIKEGMVVATSPAAEPIAGAARRQPQTADVDIPPAETGRRVKKDTATPPVGAGNPELEHFFEAGAFVSRSSASPQVIKTAQFPHTVGDSTQKEIKKDPTSQPDPEDVIDWLLKKKERNAH